MEICTSQQAIYSGNNNGYSEQIDRSLILELPYA